MASSSQALEEVTLSMGGLEITIRNKRDENLEWEVVDGPGTEEHYDSDIDRQVLASKTVESLRALVAGPLSFLKPLANKLQDKGVWCANSRVARAYQKGVMDRLKLQGIEFEDDHKFPVLPLKASHHICLQCDKHLDGFWASSLTTVKAEIPEINARYFSCASRTEGEAYLLGAKRDWPKFLK